jgi:transposase-like protein
MSKSVLSAKHFHDEAAAYAWVEARVWPQGPVCPHCGGFERIGLMGGKSTRIGTYKCYQCRKPFTVKVGTVFEASHVPMHLWVQAMFLLTSSKKGISSNQLHRTLGVTLKTAWFMSHRIRHAMQTVGLAPMGGDGKVVEVDETYFGKQERERPTVNRYGHPFTRGGKSGPGGKRAVLALVERGGNARTFHVSPVSKGEVTRLAHENIAKESTFHSDESRLYYGYSAHYAKHETVKHSRGVYVRGEIHTNTVENYFSVFKRGMKGTYQHCAEKHVHRYLAEFDFRYNHRIALGINDAIRLDNLVTGIVGKRLTYETTNQRV